MIMNWKNFFWLLVLSLNFVLGQEDFYASQTRFMQKTNPSYLGMNNLNKIGLLYNSLSVGGQNSGMDNKYLFGAFSFDQNKFSLGFDVNSLKIISNDLTVNIFKFTYVYKVQVTNKTYFLPAITLGIGSKQVNKDGFIFEDQLNATTGFINTETIDPLGEFIDNVNYFDLGASLILHNQNYIFGLSLKHLNRPNTSLNKEKEYSMPVSISLQGGYEFDVNPYEQNFLPRYSFLFTYASITRFEENLYLNLIEEIRMGEFSVSFNQKLSNVEKFNLNNLGFSAGLSLENFDLGLGYNFPVRSLAKIHSPSIFEIIVTFDFSRFRRNQRGYHKHLQTDNY